MRDPNSSPEHKYLKFDQIEMQKQNLSANSWDGSTSQLIEILSDLYPENDFSKKELRYTKLSSNQFEEELMIFYQKESNQNQDSEALFIGDALQFLYKQIIWGDHPPPDSFAVSTSLENNVVHTIFINGTYVGTYGSGAETPFELSKIFSLNLDHNSDQSKNEITLMNAWYEAEYLPEDLPGWLIENSDVYARDVINFLPEDIQKRNQMNTRLQKYRKTAIYIVGVLFASLMLLQAGSKYAVNNMSALSGSQNDIRANLNDAIQQNIKLKNQLQAREINISDRSNHTEIISHYESLLPKSISLKQLSIMAPLSGDEIYHEIQGSTNGKDDIYQLLGRLNTMSEIDEVSLEKTIPREDGTVDFELNLKYKAN